MTTTIALAGKGGVGKTTIAGMIIKYLAQNQPAVSSQSMPTPPPT